MIKKIYFAFLVIALRCTTTAMEPIPQEEPTIKTQTFGNHTLQIQDHTGKFSVFKRLVHPRGNQKILLDYKLDGKYPQRLEDGVFNETYKQELTPLLHFSDIVRFIIEDIKKESIIKIIAMDAQGRKEIFYHCPKNEEFCRYFMDNPFYKHHFRIRMFNYHLVPHIPDSILFSKEIVQTFLRESFYPFMEKNLTQEDHYKISQGNLKAFYNRHGIILNWDAHNLNYFRTPMSVYYPLQKGTCLYLNPSDYKISQKYYEFRLSLKDKLRLFHVRCKKTLSALSLIFTYDKCFFNGEPATIMTNDEILELWGNCSEETSPVWIDIS